MAGAGVGVKKETEKETWNTKVKQKQLNSEVGPRDQVKVSRTQKFAVRAPQV